MSEKKTRDEAFTELYEKAVKTLPDYKALSANFAAKAKLKQKINDKLDILYGEEKK